MGWGSEERNFEEKRNMKGQTFWRTTWERKVINKKKRNTEKIFQIVF